MQTEKIQLSLFDIFAFIAPGAVIALAVWLVWGSSRITVQDFVVTLTNLSTSSVLIGSVVAYLIGFVINTFGYELHQRVGLKLWKIPETLIVEGQKNSQKNVLIREYSPNNLIYLEKWLSYRAFSHNLALALLIFAIGGTIKYFAFKATADWLILSIVAILAVFPLLYRAHLYQKLYYLDLNSAIKELKLERKTENEAETKSTKR